MKSSNQHFHPTSAASMPMSQEQRQELLRAHVAPTAMLLAGMLAMVWWFSNSAWQVGLIGLALVVGSAIHFRSVQAIKDLLDQRVFIQTATLTARDITMPLEGRRALGDEEPLISGYYGVFEGIGKLRIGYTAYEESTIGAAYRVTFSRASQRAWAVEPAA
jgi:hypothetical protein